MKRENVENIYRLSPVQQGMLFHTLYSPQEGVYFEQFNMPFGAGFEPALFERAWRELVDRNPVLRTSFAWEGLEEPVQIVHKRVELPYEVVDWRALPEEEKEERLRLHAAAERRRGFDLSRPPLLRFSVVRLRDDLYRVLWSYHHLVLDGWSVGLLSQEVAALYQAAASGKPVRAQQRRPFRDYIAWLRQQDLSQGEAYWRRVLGGFTTPTPLGVDRPASRGRHEDRGRGMEVAVVPEAETEALKAWARQGRLTLSSAVQGAWALVLCRYSGEDDVVFGLTVSGRPPALPGVEAMLGCFINTLPVRVRLPAGSPVLPWLQALQADQVELRRYEHSPLVQVLGWSDVPRPTPLFESIFVFEGFMETAREGVFQRTNYPLTLVAGPDREMVLRADYELERFEPAAVERLLGHLRSALTAFAADPGRRLEEVEILAPEERRQLLAGAIPAAAAVPALRLHEIFEAQAERRPEAPAVTCEDETLTYRELNERANRLAHHLRRLGVGPEARVGLCVERSCEMIEGILGILKAGGAYVPLDPRYPAARLAFIAEDSGMDVLVTAEPLRELVPVPVMAVCLDTADLAGESGANLESGAGPENLAYVIYTSGSTGRPKGSLVTHANAARLFTETDAWFHFGESDVWTLFHSFAFDFSVWEIWGALLYGGRLVMVPYWVSRSPEAFHELLVRERVTVLNQTPSAFRQLVQADLEAAGGPLALRFVIFGGEALELSSLAPWFERHGDQCPLLVNMYGITETTVHVTWRPVTREDLPEAGRSPVGVPIPDLAVHLLDRHGNPVPVGVAGEMSVAGAGIARGYLGRPDLTAERFVPDPFGGPGARLYRSGDLARRLPDGGLEYLGRIDHQVKIRGFRIELGEIEAAVLAHPAVRETVVLVREGPGEDRRLVAYVVPRDGGIDVASLRSSLKERLPEHMVPAAFVELASLPLTAHGKVDRRALPDPAESQTAGGGVSGEPRTPTEEIVAGLWTEILGIERIGRGDNFFDLGGHSLMATRLLSRIREAFEVDLPLRALFEAPVLSELAQGVDAERARARQMEVPPLAAVPREGDPPLSFGQERLWFLEQLSPGSAAYNVPAALRLRGPLSVPALLGALRAIVDRHESLRTTFGTAAGRPVQVIAPSLEVPLPLVDLAALPETEREAAALDLARAATRTPFRLDRGPLFRALLLRLSGEDHAVVLTVHHIVSDEWSMGILTGELAALYTGRAASALPPLPVQYADYAQWLRGWLRGEVLERELAWWRQALAGAPTVLDLATDRPRPAVQSFRGTRQTLWWPGDLLPAAVAYSRSQGATVFMTLLAAFQALLGRYTGQSDLLVGSTIAGRSRIELEGLIGFFVNSLVLRGTLDWNAGFRDLLAQVRERTLSAYAHQDLPFERIVEELQPQRDLSRSPLFQVVFQLQNAAAGPAPEIPGLTVSPLAADSETAKFDLVLTLAESGQGLGGNWSYSTDLFDAATVRRLTDHLRTLLEAALADPRRCLGELPLLSGSERHQLLAEAGEAGVEVEEGPCLHQLFAACAARFPESIAVSFEGEALTYAELERRTNQLARHLRRLGVVRGSRVGLSVERSLATVVGVLGILKAGAAYVPLDPTYPKDRLEFALADSGVRILLTEEWLAADRDRIEEESGDPFENGATGADVAYVIYTSGSTGRPKGVLVRHFNAVRLFTATEEWFHFGPSDVWTLFHSIAFDFSVWELWGALLYGGRLVVVPFGVSRSPGEFHGLLRRERVTVLNQTPSAFRQLIRADETAGEDGRLAELRWVVFGGEALELASLAPWLERYGDERPRLVNMYGITETTVHVTWRPLSRQDLAAGSVIGRPIPDLSLTLVDARMEPVPIGVPGEILVGGSGLAVGYLGRPDLTAERFVPDPFGGRPGARLYRSGDLARRRANGDIEYLGRIDHQVKIRGFRIELGEIETALARHPAVREAVVLVREAREARLVAYVVARGDLTLGTVRDFLARTLPDYMLPSALVVLPALPLTPNGKIDRRALPEPEADRAQASAGYVAPRDALERLVAGIWSEVLGIERIGVHDDFFELGGNSILGAVLINRLQEELGEIIHVVAIFDAPTIAGLAELLRGSSGPAAAGRIGEAEVAEVRSLIQPLPLPPPETPAEPRNPPAVFVLAPPRSGTTLLRVMLGGHPRLFSPPELELLTFRTLAERRAAFQGRDSFWLEGLIRAVMEIRGCGTGEARETVEACERDGWTSQRFYRQMQEWLGDRRLVDKTPSYTLSPPVLERAEAEFEEPLYLHLVRHPYGMIASFEEAKLDQIFFRQEHRFSRRELAELIWLVSQRNILDFLRRVPAGRQLQVRFEDLVREPAAVMERVCAFLGLDLHPDMVLPYKNERARMTDGLHAESRMLGDVKFHQHQGVEASVAERWRETYTEDFLGDATWDMAARLGYDVEKEAIGRDWKAGEPLPLSFAQERLWFLDQLDPGTRTYNVSTAVRLLGRLDLPALGGALNEIVRRHASLRTTFTSAQGSPAQAVAPELRLAMPVVDLSGLPEPLREEEARAVLTRHAGEPFDLARGPLLRALLLRLGAEDHAASFIAHHIVCDGWSIGVLVREVAVLYTAAVEGEVSPLPELRVQYADFAAWQRRWLQGSALEDQLAYWGERLDRVPVLQLPGDRPRPGLQSFQGSTHGFTLPADLSVALRALSRERGVTVFMAVLAAFQALLSRLSGQRDFAVGSPVAGRNRRELEPLIGFFVNTLVFRAGLSGDPGYGELLDRVRQVALGAYAHQDVPFEKVVQELAPERNLSYTPLFQVMLAFQNVPAGRLDLPGLTLAPMAEDFTTSKFDVSLTVFDQGPRIFGQWVYSVALFDGETIARWAGNLQTLLQGALAEPERPLSELSLLTPEERRQILVEWNRPPADYPDEGFVHRLFEEQAGRTPEAVAVAFEGESLTYRELNARANRLARHLRRLGVGPEALVGISAERSFEMVVGLLAVLKAGGAYVPLDPALPAERLSYMVEDAGIGLLLTQERLLSFLPLEESPENPGFPVFPENPAYVIYTSGSTGQPKGVVISHRALGNRLQYARAGDLTADDAFLQKTTISFDVSVLEIFAPLVAGGRTVLARPGGQRDPVYLVRTIREQEITYTSFPPSLLHVLFEQPGFDRCDSLRTVITGGETVPAVLPGQFYERLPGADLLNRYGPTEATISVTSWRCERDDADTAPRTLPIGRPTAKASVYLLDAGLQPVPVGVAGELHLGGLCLARGYLNRPDLTAEKFIPDPFSVESAEAGARLYRTGDLARYRADGAIEFVGRADSQVKIRGFRVELGEIEAVLARHPAVREVAVVDREDGAGRSLAAYVVPQPGEPVDEADLRRFLGETLPAYMVPSDFVSLDALPLAPTGKVDRQALPAPDRRGLKGAIEPPRNPTEELLAAFWADLLSLEGVGIHDSFFELGGHSLLATQAMSRVREAFGVDLPLRLLFERPTVAALAEEVDAAVRAGARLEAPPLVPMPRDEDPPLSFAQERLWFLDRLQPGTSTYNLPLVVRLHGPLSVPAFAASLRQVVRRHEALRTTFAVRGGRPVQLIAPEPALPMPLLDLEGLPGQARDAEALRIAREVGRRPFDLEAGPLVRAVLMRLERGEHMAAVVMHHIVSDGWSIGIVIREVAALYGAAVAGKPSPLPELPVQYADFARWQRDWLRGEALAAELAYWRQRLAGMPPLLELPTDRPRPAVQRFRGRNLQRVLSQDFSRELKVFCRQAGSTPFMVLLAGFQALIHRYTGRRDVVVGSPVAGRDRLETEDLIGFFLNSLVMRTGVEGDPGFQALLERVRETALGAYVHQSLPFEKLVEELAPERNLSHAPLFQVMLVFQNTPRALPEHHGITFSPVELDTDAAKFDLTLNARESARGLVLVWLYNRDLFDAATVARFAGHLETLLAAAVAHPERPLSELPLLTPVEERQLLDWNDTAVPYPAEVCLHELIEAQVERGPDRVAVVFERASLTYRELNTAANQLAHRLTAMGVGPEVVVGVFAERSLEMVVALLAILKAGGAYLPLDPDYPEDRLHYMLESSRVSVLLTQPRLAERLPKTGARVVLLDGGETGMEEEANPASGVRPGNLAYVIYTSGSTGRPKGVMNTHLGIVNRLLWMQREYGLTPEDRVLQKTPFSFDVSVWEFFWPLLTGARLVMARPGGHQDAAWLARTIQAEGITTLHFVPSMLQVFLEAPGVEGCVSLIRVIASGEALPYELQRRFFRRLGAGLHNLYGPTEAAVDVTYWACEAEGRRGVVPIGRPVANTRIHLLDVNLRPVPVGVPGELHIGGVQVARGYLGRPELTAERFLPDPFSPEPGARLYRTGDLARHLPDGAIDFLGRIDHQVKLRGLRIELGEIETAIAAHPGVREAVVLTRSEGSGALGAINLVAYVTKSGAAEPAPAELRTLLARSLPEYMIPSSWVMLDALPLSPNGKVDRKALARIAPERTAGVPAERVAPRTELERALAALWSEALGGNDGFGIHDNFFELGGNSITGAILINRLQEILGEIVHVVAVFDAPTVASLAASLARDYPEAVARIWGPESLGEAARAVTAQVSRPLDESRLAEVRRLIRTLPPVQSATVKNPPALFVLSPPRSGSTLLRVMLGGHPGLFAPPELELLNFNTLAERREAFQGRDSFRLEGLLRAVMEIRGQGPDDARALVQGFEAEGLTTQEVYGRLQKWIGPRLLVDKTPTYAWDPATLRRAEETFEGARYLHLVRHPYGMIRSFEEARIDQIFFHEDHPVDPPLTRRELAEALWAIAHRNVLEFLARVPQERQHTVRFEDLLRDPEGALLGICAFLGIEYHPDMAEPYKRRSERMTDGLHAESRMLGDVKFHQHGAVDRTVAEAWRRHYTRDFLGGSTWRLAARLGYDIEKERAGAGWPPPSLVKLRPGSPDRPLFLVHPLSGEFLLYRHLIHGLGPDQAVYGFQAQGFKEGEQPLERIEEMADLYVESLLAFQPEGPYLLAGSSMGGLIAFEMARRLQGLGREVALTALLDAPSPGRVAKDGDGEAEMDLLRYATGGRTTRSVDDLLQLTPDQRLELILEAGREAGGLAAGMELADLRRLVKILEANRGALRAYRPEPAGIRAVYVRAAEGVRADAVWRALALGGLEVHEVAGNHLSMHFPPQVESLAARLASCVEWAAVGAGARDEMPARASAALRLV